MAENRRGGRRAGRPGAKYPNRTDIALSPRTAPIARIPGQGYGTQAAQVAGQQAVPMGQPAQQRVTVDLSAPSERPDEPVTHGLSTGPGAGPEVLGFPPADSGVSPPGSERLRQMLPTLELMASQRNSSQALRQLVRTIRGGVQ